MKATFQEVQAVKTPLLTGWGKPERFAPIKAWVQDLVMIASGGVASTLSWEIVGRAAMIINDSKDYGQMVIRQIAQDSGYQLKELEADKIFEFFAGGFTEIQTPTIVVMPLGVWSTEPKDHANAEEIKAFHKKFAEILSEIPADKHLVFVTYGDDPRGLVEDLRSAGAFDRRFFVDDVSLHDRGQAFIEMLPRDICGSSLLADPEVVGQVLECEADDDRRAGLIAIALKRLAHREGRKVEFGDLVNFALHGTGEYVPNESPKGFKQSIALHEAGHAVISIIDSAGKNIPDYAGIVPSVGTLGQVSASYEFLAALPSIGNYKYKRHLVRVLLAGRAAEQLAVGIEDMSVTSARGDLRHATDIAKDLIGRYGISPTLEDESTAGSNLLLKSGADISDAEKHRVENAARLFLSRQYDVVLEQLRANRALLEAIADRLVVKQVLDKHQLESMALEYGVLNAEAV